MLLRGLSKRLPKRLSRGLPRRLLGGLSKRLSLKFFREVKEEGSWKPKITRITSKIKVFDPNTSRITRITSKIKVFDSKTTKI